MNPTKCHVINKFEGDNIFCILLQQELQELYYQELKRHFLLWEKAWWVFRAYMCQFSWPKKLNIMWHISVCFAFHLGNILCLGVDIITVWYCDVLPVNTSNNLCGLRILCSIYWIHVRQWFHSLIILLIASHEPATSSGMNYSWGTAVTNTYSRLLLQTSFSRLLLQTVHDKLLI
jgi:hypothetical protein